MFDEQHDYDVDRNDYEFAQEMCAHNWTLEDYSDPYYVDPTEYPEFEDE